MPLIFNEDKFISIKEYNDWCKKTNNKPNYEELKMKNQEFIKNHLICDQTYFDNMFCKFDEKITLDEEQRKIILNDDDYCLINAGAGSGKSTTMAAKVKYLVDKKKINPKEIIMLSFTRKSSEDLDEKVNDLLELGIPVSTFHSLGMNFIRKIAQQNFILLLIFA